MAINDGGAAFPRASAFHNGFDEAHAEQDGMTLRDYFAAKAMQGFQNFPLSCDYEWAGEVAKQAYRLADAMLKARDGKAGA